VPYRKPDPALPKLGARLALTRRALTLTRFQMARLLGTDTWDTYEAGLERIPPEHGQALRLRHPAGLDLRRQDGEPAPARPRQNPGGAGSGLSGLGHG
jgi:hypothetical protein